MGSAGILYIALDTNRQYRWTGTTYQVITSGAVDSVAGKTGVVTLDKTDVGLSNVDNTADNIKSVLSASKLTTSRSITITGDISWSVNFDGSTNVTADATLSSTGVSAGTYKSVTVGADGRITDGTNPNTISGFGITDAYTKTDIGAIDTDYVAVFNASLI